MLSTDVVQALGTQENRSECVLGFNKVNGVFLFALANTKIEDLTNPGHFVFVTDQMSLTEDVVQGTYPDYKIVAKSDLPQVIYEMELDQMMATKITERYPIAEQVNILGRAVQTLAKEHGIELDELEELLDYIQLARNTNREHKESYANDPAYQYISNAELAEQELQRYEGGVHEALGPRQVTGGRVFS
ncbi:hypothetical protein [Pseudomonas phage D6]|nr:hypothetical protein [Pseudomonas phage D6]